MTRLLTRSSGFTSETNFSLSGGASLSAAQMSLDASLHSLSSNAADYRSLLAMTAGGLAYQLGKWAALSTAPFIAPLVGLACETSAFRATHTYFQKDSHSQIFGQGWVATALDFALMKGMGQAMRGQGRLLQTAAQSSAVVIGQNFSSALHLLPAHHTSNSQRFMEATLMGMEMAAGLALGHGLTAAKWQRLQSTLELQNRVLERRSSFQKENLNPISQFSNEMNAAHRMRALRCIASREEILHIHEGLNFKDRFPRASLEELLVALENANLSPQVTILRLRSLETITDLSTLRSEFIRTLLKRKYRPMSQSNGRARFVDFDSLKKEADRIAVADSVLTQSWAKDVLRAIQAPVILADVNFGRRENYLRVLDHHGVYAQPRNATQQMLDLFEETLRREGGEAALIRPTFAQVQRAMEDLNIREVSTDNLADGAWCVWIAQNQRRVLMNRNLRETIRQATYFEDFSAFGNNYDRTHPAVELQSALFKHYGDRLRDYGVSGSDRFSASRADELMMEVVRDITHVLRDPALRRQTAMVFWQEVDRAREVAARSVVLDRQDQGRSLFAFYSTRALREFSIFAQWLSIPDLQRDLAAEQRLPLQATLAPMPPLRGLQGDLPRMLPIIAIPHGRRLPSGKGLLGALAHMNREEALRVEQLIAQGHLPVDARPNFWFGKDQVILPNPAGGGTLLTAHEIADILQRAELGLFNAELN